MICDVGVVRVNNVLCLSIASETNAGYRARRGGTTSGGSLHGLNTDQLVLQVSYRSGFGSILRTIFLVLLLITNYTLILPISC